jgi:hypothetical protein
MYLDSVVKNNLKEIAETQFQSNNKKHHFIDGF